MAGGSKYNHVIGLGVYYHSDDRISYSALEVSNRSNTLSIGKKYQSDSLDDLITAVGKSNPIVAIIYGHGVLDKQIPNLVPGETGISNKAIPGLNLQEYYTSEHSYPNSGWVSLAKKEKIDKTISELANKGLSIIDLSIGVTGLCPLISIIELKSDVSLDGLQIQTNQKVLESIKPIDTTSESVNIDGQSLPASFLPAYAAALNYFIESDCRITDSDILNDHQETFKYSQRTKKVLQIGLAILMLLALANAYLFNNVYQQNERIAITVSAQRPLLEKVSELKSQKDQLEKAIGPIDGTKTQQAYYIDQIGASLEGSKIILQSINLYPLLSDRKKVNAGDFQFDQSSIVIEGLSKDPRRFGEWVASMREMEWVSTVEISPFKKNVEGEDEFVVMVTMVGG